MLKYPTAKMYHPAVSKVIRLHKRVSDLHMTALNTTYVLDNIRTYWGSFTKETHIVVDTASLFMY